MARTAKQEAASRANLEKARKSLQGKKVRTRQGSSNPDTAKANAAKSKAVRSKYPKYFQ